MRMSRIRPLVPTKEMRGVLFWDNTQREFNLPLANWPNEFIFKLGARMVAYGQPFLTSNDCFVWTSLLDQLARYLKSWTDGAWNPSWNYNTIISHSNWDYKMNSVLHYCLKELSLAFLINNSESFEFLAFVTMASDKPSCCGFFFQLMMLKAAQIKHG